MPFRVGQRLWIACDVKQGMSPAERSIRFEFSAHEKRIVSGFVPERFVKPGSKGLPARVAGGRCKSPSKGEGESSPTWRSSYFHKSRPRRRLVAEGPRFLTDHSTSTIN